MFGCASAQPKPSLLRAQLSPLHPIRRPSFLPTQSPRRPRAQPAGCSYAATGPSDAALDPVASWYDDEVRLYNFSSPGFQPPAGHMTQLAWRDSAGLGCAARVCAGGVAGGLEGEAYARLVVCRYHPPGNVGSPDDYARNVPPPLEGGGGGGDGGGDAGSAAPATAAAGAASSSGRRWRAITAPPLALRPRRRVSALPAAVRRRA